MTTDNVLNEAVTSVLNWANELGVKYPTFDAVGTIRESIETDFFNEIVNAKAKYLGAQLILSNVRTALEETN